MNYQMHLQEGTEKIKVTLYKFEAKKYMILNQVRYNL